MLYSVCAICLGASAGAVLRWLFGLALHNVFSTVSAGTLAANLLGCYLAGCAFGAFAYWPEFGERWGLLVVTGFLGALTTFSAFSTEVIALIQDGRVAWAGGVIVLHVCGALGMTFLGLATFSVLRGLMR